MLPTSLKRFLWALLAVVVAIFLHLSVRYFLPHPYNTLNIIFVQLILMLLYTERGSVVWVSFFIHLLLELYTVVPFGITLFSGTVAMLLTYWLSRIVFTNRSWYSSVVLGFLGVVLYRALYLGLLIILEQFVLERSLSFDRLSILFAWEVLFSTLLSVIGYFVWLPIYKRFGEKRLVI